MRADLHRWVHSVLQVCPQLSECLTICLVCKDRLNASARVCTCLQRLLQTLQTRQRNWKFLMRHDAISSTHPEYMQTWHRLEGAHGQPAESKELRVGSGEYRPRMFWTFDQTRPGPGRPGAAIELAQAFEGTRRGTVHGGKSCMRMYACRAYLRVHDLGKNGRKPRSGRSQVAGPGIARYHDARIPVIPVHRPRFMVPRASIPGACAARVRVVLASHAHSSSRAPPRVPR